MKEQQEEKRGAAAGTFSTGMSSISAISSVEARRWFSCSKVAMALCILFIDPT